MLAAANDALQRIRSSKRCPSIVEILRMIELGFDLGRLACGLPLTGKPPPSQPPPLDFSFQEALQKIYGDGERQIPAPANHQEQTINFIRHSTPDSVQY